MRLIIESDYQALSNWAANYVAQKINKANPTAEKPFVIIPDEKKQQFEIVRSLLNRPDVDSVTAATDAG